jgi:hypothetical protein
MCLLRFAPLWIFTTDARRMFQSKSRCQPNNAHPLYVHHVTSFVKSSKYGYCSSAKKMTWALTQRRLRDGEVENFTKTYTIQVQVWKYR